MLDGELTHEKRDENDSENVADSGDGHTLLKWKGLIIKCYEGLKISKVQYDPPLKLSTKEYIMISAD